MLGDYKFYLNLEKRKIKDELLNNMKITYRPHYGFIIFSEHDSLRCHPDLNIAQSAFNKLKQLIFFPDSNELQKNDNIMEIINTKNILIAM